MNHTILIACFCKYVASKTDIQRIRANGPPPKECVPSCAEMNIGAKKKLCCCHDLDLCYDTLPQCQETCNKQKKCKICGTNM